ncbi:MAG: hypothetical protein ABI833_09925 [Acidobacteriota bacterium]
MDVANKNWNISRRFSFSKNILQTTIGLLGLMLTSSMAQAVTVTVDLGQSAQSFGMAGTGPNGAGLGQYVITMGSCSPSGGNTTCTISGNFTGTTPGFTSGTYSLVTIYPGSGPTPFLGIEQSIGSNFFSFTFVPPTATMTLILTSASGTFVAPILTGGQLVASLGFAYTAGATCAVVSPTNCSVAQVGVTAGSTITGPVIGSATFTASVNYYISDLAFSDGWQSTLTYNNYSPATVTCVTNFYGDSGAPLAVPFAQGTATTRTDVLPPGGSIHDQTVANPAFVVVQGWAQATCTGPVQASLVFRLYKKDTGVPVGEAGVNAEAAPTTQFATFAQTATGVAYANPSTTQSATITVHRVRQCGRSAGEPEHHPRSAGPRICQRRTVARAGKFHGTGQDHVHDPHHQPVAEFRGSADLFFFASRGSVGLHNARDTLKGGCANHAS